MSKQKVIFTIGLVASGKTTWAKELIKKDQSYKRVCRDDLRHMLSNYTFNNENEKLVTKVKNDIIENILMEGYNLIVDETNLNFKRIKETITKIAEVAVRCGLDIEYEYKKFEVSLEEAISRDRARDFSVGEKVIKRMYFQYIFKENLPDERIPYNEMLEDAIIVDVDGTLAYNPDRNAYDYLKVKEDKCKPYVIELIKILKEAKECKVFIFSGREDVCIDDTMEWLTENGIPFDFIAMRKAKDKRKDSIVKEELYRKNVEGKYNVLYWVDDRKQVIDHMRELGLPVLDVAGHTF